MFLFVCRTERFKQAGCMKLCLWSFTIYKTRLSGDTSAKTFFSGSTHLGYDVHCNQHRCCCQVKRHADNIRVDNHNNREWNNTTMPPTVHGLKLWLRMKLWRWWRYLFRCICCQKRKGFVCWRCAYKNKVDESNTFTEEMCCLIQCVQKLVRWRLCEERWVILAKRAWLPVARVPQC